MLVTMEKKIAKTFNEKVLALISQDAKRNRLYGALRGYQEDHHLKDLVYGLKKIINEPKLVELYEQVRPLIPVKHQMEYDKLVPCYPSEKLRTIRLSRANRDGLGFAVRGGLEHGVGVFVSHVSPDSQAYHQGLRVGDEIVRLNGFTICQAIHEEILNLIKAKNEVTLKVRNVGMLPVKDNATDQLTWQYVDGGDPGKTLQQVLDGQKDATEVKLYINVAPGSGLGCSICSGPPEMPGIFIQAIRKGGLAEEAGLEVGDQIAQVNGTIFHNITHAEAVVALKGTRSLNMTIRKSVAISLFGAQNLNIKEDDKKNLKMALRDLEETPSMGQGSFKAHKYQIDRTSLKQTNEEVEQEKWAKEIRKSQKQEDLVQQAIKAIDDKENTRSANEFRASLRSDHVGGGGHPAEVKQVTFSAMPENVSYYDPPSPRRPSTSMVGNPVTQPLEVNTTDPSTGRLTLQVSPMYMSEERTPSFRIQKPVLLHPQGRSNDNLSRSPIPEEIYPEGGFNEDNFQPYRIFTNEEIAGRQVRLVNIQKEGYSDLGVLIESTNAAPPLGQILVAEIFDDGAIQAQGGLHAGDQIMMVNGRSLLDVSLQEAQQVLKDEFRGPRHVMQMVIAKAPPTDLGEEVTYF